MKKFSTRGVVAVAMIAALGISAPAIASATPRPTTTTIATTSTTIVTHAQWKQWQKLEDAYVDQLKVINKTFRASVDVARKEYWAAIKASKGSREPPSRACRGPCGLDALDRQRDAGPFHRARRARFAPAAPGRHTPFGVHRRAPGHQPDLPQLGSGG